MAKSSEDSVGASIGITKNLGNYESMRIDAWANRSLDDPSNKDHVAEKWAEVWEEIEGQIEAQLLEASKGLE